MQKLSEAYGRVVYNRAFTNIHPFNRKVMVSPMRTLRAQHGVMQYQKLPK